MKKVVATKEAVAILKKLESGLGPVVLIHSEGCCEGTSPICIPKNDFHTGSQDLLIGDIEGIPYYMHRSNESYWRHLQIVVDVKDGIGNSFSLESTLDKTFVILAKKLKE